MRQITLKKPVASVSSLRGSARVVFAATFACFMSAASLPAQGATNVFNDAVFWFRGGKDIYDINGNISSDGYMQQGEFFDDLHADDASHNNHKMSMVSYAGKSGKYSHSVFAGNAAFAIERVVFPSLGSNVADNSRVLHISNSAKKIDSTNYYFPFVANPRSVFVANNISNEYTVVGRIRLDDGSSRNECFLRLGYNTNNLARQGMWLGFTKPASWYAGCKRIGGYCAPNSDDNDRSFQLNLPVPTNTWVDIAVVVGNGKLRVGVAVPESSSSHNNNPTIAFDETAMWTDNSLPTGDYYRMFCLDGQTAPKDIDGADKTCFVGSVQQLAIWGRALEDHEVMAAFGMPRPSIFRTGLDNGSSSEFGGERPDGLVATQEIDGLGSWQSVWVKMLAGDVWTNKFHALRDEAGLAQIFSIKSLQDSDAVQIEPILNGSSLGERRVVANARVFWPVATNLVVEGVNTLEIKRTDGGTGDFLMDAMELGGALGVGMESESATNDQRIPPDRLKSGVPSAADPNPQHWPQGLRPKTGVTNLHFRVWMDPDVVNKVTSRFWTRTRCEEEDGMTIKDDDQFLFYVNGVNKGARGSDTSWDSDPIELIFQPGELNGGWNDVEFISTSSTTNCRWLVDYYRFETVLPRGFSIPPPGLSIVIR
ncbi:MAG: hypothetical protein IKQ17_04720 [Kiritimatiellae bacterium]|nr:hypothetical protein [Kiritimatiellia bacterium]